MDWRTEENLLKGIRDIVNTSQKQHEEEIVLLNKQHKEVVQELLKQAQTAETNHNAALKEARQQVKYSRLAFIIALAALVVTIVFGVIQHLPCK